MTERLLGLVIGPSSEDLDRLRFRSKCPAGADSSSLLGSIMQVPPVGGRKGISPAASA
ncbi:hypothetical protein CPC08DRAFT_707776 [Agrocybe pediades]|nr:hypothetical protein CPC08DRAFT_707776 [Agrocybe pediades]